MRNVRQIANNSGQFSTLLSVIRPIPGSGRTISDLSTAGSISVRPGAVYMLTVTNGRPIFGFESSDVDFLSHKGSFIFEVPDSENTLHYSGGPSGSQGYIRELIHYTSGGSSEVVFQGNAYVAEDTHTSCESFEVDVNRGFWRLLGPVASYPWVTNAWQSLTLYISEGIRRGSQVFELPELAGLPTFTATITKTISPRFVFTACTVEAYVNGSLVHTFVSDAAASISVTAGDTVEYIFSNFNGVTLIDIANDDLSGDWTGVVLPTALTHLFIRFNSFIGDMAAITLPNTLITLDVRNNSGLTGDWTNKVWSSVLSSLQLSNCDFTGDAATWNMPTGMRFIQIEGNSFTYESTSGFFSTLPQNLSNAADAIELQDNSLTQAHIDNILEDLGTSGVTGKQARMAGNNASPSLDGSDDLTLLQRRGWFVDINIQAFRWCVTAGSTTPITPRFFFSSGSIVARVNNVLQHTFTSGVSASIAVSSGDTVDFECTEWNTITNISVADDGFSGDQTGMQWPTDCNTLFLQGNAFTGTVDRWVLADDLDTIAMGPSSISGDIANKLGSSIRRMFLSSNDLSGDLGIVTTHSSTWSIALLDGNEFSYSSTGGIFSTWPSSLPSVNLTNNNLTQSEVDNVFADCDTSGQTSKTLSIGGSNSSPTNGSNNTNLRNLIDNKSWTITFTA